MRYTNSGKCVECHKARNASRKRGKTKAGEVLPPVEIIEPVNKDRRYFVTNIAATWHDAWQKAVPGIIATGKLLIEAKRAEGK